VSNLKQEARLLSRHVVFIATLFNLPCLAVCLLALLFVSAEKTQNLAVVFCFLGFMHFMNVAVAWRGRAGAEMPFGFLYGLMRVITWSMNVAILGLIVLSGGILFFPLGTLYALAWASGIWALYETSKSAVPKKPSLPPIETAFVDKGMEEKQMLMDEYKVVRTSHARLRILAELAPIFGPLLILFSFALAQRDGEGSWQSASLMMGAGILICFLWFYARRSREKAAIKHENFYRRHPAARPSIGYMHRIQERRLTRLLPKIEESLRQSRAVTYTPPEQIRVPLWRGIFSILLWTLFVVVILGAGLYGLYVPQSFVASDDAIMAGAAFAGVIGMMLLLRWRAYENDGYIPPELRKTPRRWRGLEKVAFFAALVFYAYFASVHGGMRFVHEMKGHPEVIESVRVEDARIGRSGSLCMKVPAFSTRRRLFCTVRQTAPLSLAVGTARPDLTVKASPFGLSIKGATISGIFYLNVYGYK